MAPVRKPVLQKLNRSWKSSHLALSENHRIDRIASCFRNRESARCWRKGDEGCARVVGSYRSDEDIKRVCRGSAIGRSRKAEIRIRARTPGSRRSCHTRPPRPACRSRRQRTCCSGDTCWSRGTRHARGTCPARPAGPARHASGTCPARPPRLTCGSRIRRKPSWTRPARGSRGSRCTCVRRCSGWTCPACRSRGTRPPRCTRGTCVRRCSGRTCPPRPARGTRCARVRRGSGHTGWTRSSRRSHRETCQVRSGSGKNHRRR